MNLSKLVNNPEATIIDVREPWEFFFGHVKGSKNIPLGKVAQQVNEFKAMAKPIILVCASGNRSGQAANFLTQQGIKEVYNGGGWVSVKQSLAV